MNDSNDNPGRKQNNGSNSSFQKNERGLKRRRVLKLASVSAIGGFGPIAKAQRPSDSGSSSSTVDVPMLISGDEIVKYLTVPEDWHQHRKHASKVHDQVRENIFLSTPGIVGSALIRSPKTYGGKHGLQIEAIIDTREYNGSLPSEVDGIPLTTEKEPDKYGPADCEWSSDNCVNRDTSTDVAGGEYLGWENGGYGTSTCTVYDEVTNKYVMLHCAHVFWNDCDDATNNSLNGRNAERPNGTNIGEVDYYNVDADFSVIDHSLSSGSFNDYIDDNKHFPYVAGYVTKDTLASWASSSSDPCQWAMGVNTSRTKGRVKKIEANYTNSDCTNMENEGVYTYADHAQGDSGGPTYHLYDGEAYIVNCAGYNYYWYKDICGGAKVGSDSAGVAAYHIDDYGFTFGRDTSF